MMHHNPDRSWITDPDPDRPKGTHPEKLLERFLTECHKTEIKQSFRPITRDTGKTGNESKLELHVSNAKLGKTDAKKPR